MTDAPSPNKPAWQTEDLEDEWIDEDEEPATVSVRDKSDLSYTNLVGSILVRRDDASGSLHASSSDDGGAGTFLIREDVPATPFLPKTPGKSKKSMVKGFFSPLALEMMFEPPSPPKANSTPLPPPSTNAPAVPSRLSQMYVPSEDSTEVHSEGGLREAEEVEGESQGDDGEDKRGEPVLTLPEAAIHYEFTFAPPEPNPFNSAGAAPNAQSTPIPPGRQTHGPVMTDPRLRLFHFQYDTFTRDHLSAMVDSIAVNTPSGNTTPSTADGSAHGISRASERSISRLRSAKRIKLSPASDYSPTGDGAAFIMRPVRALDYVGESRNLMEKIRQNRDFSTVSTTASGLSPHARKPSDSPAESAGNRSMMRSSSQRLRVPSARYGDLSATKSQSSGGTTNSKQSNYSSLAYREQAANLMAQIRNDMKGSKRLFSTDTETSHVSQQNVDKSYASVGAKYLPPEEEDDDATELLPESLRQPEIGTREPPDTSSSQARRILSPRRVMRKISATHDAEQELSQSLDQMSLNSSAFLDQFPQPPVNVLVTAPQSVPPSPAVRFDIQNPSPSHLAPPTAAAPAYPSSSIRSGRNEDLTRFVSSSTASGTTLTAGSAASFVKHAGPKQLTHIAPSDVPALPDRVGGMVYDKVKMRWVKAVAALSSNGRPFEDDNDAAPTDPANESEDPFRDIESLREEDSRVQDSPETRPVSNEAAEPLTDDEEGGSILTADLEQSRIEEVSDSEAEDMEEVELNSFSFDSMDAVVATESGYANPLDIEDSEEMEDDEEEQTITETSFLTGLDADQDESAVDDDDDDSPAQSPPRGTPRPSFGKLSTPLPHSHSDPTALSSGVRSAMKSNSITPVSALKDPSRNRFQTPLARLGHRRSVSFSDGKREGPILGVGRNAPTPDVTEGSAETESEMTDLSKSQSQGPSEAVPSARSKRIADMLQGIEDSAFHEDSPSKASSVRPPQEELQPIQARRPSSQAAVVGSASREDSERFLSRSHSVSRMSARNATFLTECSFGVAHDRLVAVITDVQPFEPYWDQLSTIDLSKKNLDSVARLKEFLPRLDTLSLNSNQLSWLSGVPGSVRTLSVASNILTGVTSFNHLVNLESLDISDNNVDSLRQLECLRHLRELRADGNRIESVEGLHKMDGLVKLSLQRNRIRNLNLANFRWTRLEMLNLSQNRIGTVEGLETLPALVALNLDNNALGEFAPNGTMPRLRILRVSGNRLQGLDASPFPNLRTLYADNNSLGTIAKANRLTKLENLSLRNQGGRGGLNLSLHDVRDVKRLYLSGNPLKSGFISEPCYHLVYLELAACRLTALPAEFGRLVPNVRVLNLNYNFLEDTRGLEGLSRLRKLTLIGSRIRQTKMLVRMVRGMQDIEMLDFRMNPCTLGWYLPLLVKDVPGALQPSDGERAAHEDGGDAGRQKSTSRNTLARSQSKPQGEASPGASDADVSEEDGSPASAHPGALSGTLSWKDLDSKFRRDLPDDAYVGRLVYRGLIMRACPSIRLLDGVEPTAKEREKAEKILKGIVGISREKKKTISGPANSSKTAVVSS
ncbi:hypothetical protein BXZ70DRAFT_709242 [Cristinia sonorae]|uniref:Septation initiation network scaffold protein cdc11 n=1 Tax=Cristinia sonorae TaxID=1940300 RepID=A0A8K0XK71_9AGAR|nr:hypothetical protein BXZ70DRAFT_709242 [Cristinia sonorae]